MNQTIDIILDPILNRYIIVDTDTGEVIDDAQGYGYKTKQGAIKASYYKTNQQEIINNAYLIKEWWDNHKSLLRSIEDFSYYFVKENHKKVTTKDIYEEFKNNFNDSQIDPKKLIKYMYSCHDIVKNDIKRKKKAKRN